MKLVKKFALAVLFVSVLAVPTLAGDMTTPAKSDPPPPPPPATTTDETTDASFQLLYEAYMAMLGVY
jgi:hypothetical protein